MVDIISISINDKLRNYYVIKLITIYYIDSRSSIAENKIQEIKCKIDEYLIRFYNIGVVNRYTMYRAYVCVWVGFSYLFPTHTLILVLHCISILILFFVSTSDDETGYSVYLGFPGSRATYLHCRDAQVLRGTRYGSFTRVHFLTLIA